MRVPIRASSHRTRRDGWTVERRLGFLATLARSRCVTRAAASVGMSRESAYRLRTREECALFAALWNRVLAPAPDAGAESHNRVLSDGHLLRLLGNHFRRESNGFSALGSPGTAASPK